MSILLLFLLLGNVESLIPPNAFHGRNNNFYKDSLHSTEQDEISLQSQYNELGLTNDDALWNWIKNNNRYLKSAGIDVSAQKLTDNYENSIYSVFIRFHNEEMEDRVVHFYQTRGPITRFYTILGKNSNGLYLEEYNKFLWNSVAKSIAISCAEIGALGFIVSGGFSDLVHQLNSNGSMKEVIATTGVISFLCSKAIEVAAGHSARGLNPFYHLSIYLLLCQDSKHLSKYTDLTIGDILDELNYAYHGIFDQGGLNPELTVSFPMRSKSDQNWVRELKKAILAIAKKRYELTVKSPKEECPVVDEASPRSNSTINLHIENISINIGNEKESNNNSDEQESKPTSVFSCNAERLELIAAELSKKINSELTELGFPLDDSEISDMVNEVVKDVFKDD